MSEQDGLRDLLEFLESISPEMETEKVAIGKISEELRLRFTAMKKERDNLRKELSTRKDILEAEMKLKLYQEFNDRSDSNMDEKSACWDLATKELNLNPDGNWTVDFKTGILSEKVSKKEQKESDLSEQMFQNLMKRKNR